MPASQIVPAPPTSASQRTLDEALSYLRSACEALIEQVLFAGTIQRFEDHIKVQNLEDVVFDQGLALKIVDLHGRLSGMILAHNRSDAQRENEPSINDLNALRKEFDELEKALRYSKKAAQKARSIRKEAKTTAKGGW